MAAAWRGSCSPLGAAVIARTVNLAVSLFGLIAVPLLFSGCASYWVQYDRKQSAFPKSGLALNEAGQELKAGAIPCNGSLYVSREHGLFWWPGGFYRHEGSYGVYFKKPTDSSREFHFTRARYYEWPKVTEARGSVVVNDRSVVIEIEYKDAKGRWKKPPVNGVHRIDSILPDDRPSVPREPSK